MFFRSERRRSRCNGWRLFILCPRQRQNILFIQGEGDMSARPCGGRRSLRGTGRRGVGRPENVYALLKFVAMARQTRAWMKFGNKAGPARPCRHEAKPIPCLSLQVPPRPVATPKSWPGCGHNCPCRPVLISCAVSARSKQQRCMICKPLARASPSESLAAAQSQLPSHVSSLHTLRSPTLTPPQPLHSRTHPPTSLSPL